MELSKCENFKELSNTIPQDVPVIPKTMSFEKKLGIVFFAIFFVSVLANAFLFKGLFEKYAFERLAQGALFSVSVVLLLVVGYMAVRSVTKDLLKTAKDAEAIANGDISRRMEFDGALEINQLACHFNRVVEQLESTVESLRVSRRLTHDLLAQLCTLGSQPGDLSHVFNTFMKTLLSITNFNVGAMFIISLDRSIMRARVVTGLPKMFERIVIPVGYGAAGRVASTGSVEVIPELRSAETSELSEFDKCMSCSLHVPMVAAGKVRGVVSIGLTEGQKEVSIDDIQAVRNLSSQIAVALENTDLRRREEKTYIETVAALAAAVEARDTLTRGHSRRVTEFSIAIARGLNKAEWFMKDVEAAALLHDIGKIGFSDDILWNVGPIPPRDVPLVRNHPLMGENILKPVGSLSRLCPIIRHHHERFDGLGYPDGLKGDEIPLASRIIAVADSFDAMVSGRHYLPHRKTNEVIEELSRCSGTQFDPACVQSFMDYLASNDDFARTAAPN